MSKWEMYDRLIQGIPENILVEDYFVGVNWTYVKACGQLGIALTVKQRAGNVSSFPDVIGQPLQTVAAQVKSWNFIEASIGMAAINCYYNSPSRAEELGLLSDESNGKKDAFACFADDVKGKNVCVIGHFPNIERQFGPICNMSILERDPDREDYPDSACEYILADQDYVFITGMTLTNKTLPRLLEIIRPDAKVIMVGPSVPISDVLFDYGVDYLSGFSATKYEAAMEALRRGLQQQIFRGGSMVTYAKEN